MTQPSTKQQFFDKTAFPKNIKVLSTLRFITGGASKTHSGYDNFNLATHVGDDLQSVEKNRNLLVRVFNLPVEPKWLEQTHSDVCLDFSSVECAGDAVFTQQKNKVCAVLTADCLPIFACNQVGTQVGVAHAGWKGIVNGVIESFVAKFNHAELLIHFGPAISQKAFTVGAEVYQQFVDKDQRLSAAFIQQDENYQLDMYQAATIILNNLGVELITGGDQCTYTQKDKYFSYRRDGTQSGRMAHLIWIE